MLEQAAVKSPRLRSFASCVRFVWLSFFFQGVRSRPRGQACSLPVGAARDNAALHPDRLVSGPRTRKATHSVLL